MKRTLQRLSLPGWAIGCMLAWGTFTAAYAENILGSNPKFTKSAPSDIKIATVSAVVSGQGANCFGSSTGSIIITNPVGGGGTYEYSINGGISWTSSGAFSSIPAGTYKVMIRDAASTSNVVTLYEEFIIAELPQMSANVTSTNVTSCNGNLNASINISGASGGSDNFIYSINGGLNWKASPSFTGIGAGSYNVLIADANTPSCKVVLNGNVNITQPVKMQATMTNSNITGCFGNANGMISITAPTGGSNTYQYSINGGASWTNSGNFTNLAAGPYHVQMRDAAIPSCLITLNASLILTQPASLQATVSSTNITGCNGNSNGTINISSPLGGSGSYQFSIDGGANWNNSGNFTGLAAGTYSVRMRDASDPSCINNLNSALVINQLAGLEATVNSTNVTGCFGNNNGAIAITGAAGGSGAYQYSKDGGTTWVGSGSSYTFTGLNANTYSVMMRDANSPSCIMILNSQLTIFQLAPITATVTSNAVTGCSGGGNGAIIITGAAGGNGIYEYSMNGGQFWQSSGTFINLVPGTYAVMVRDASSPSCQFSLNPGLTITEPLPISATVTGTDVTCSNKKDGKISIANVGGGSGVYEYSYDLINWTGSKIATNLSPEKYIVGIRDASYTSCMTTSEIIISEPYPLTVESIDVRATCPNQPSGSASPEIFGGVMPYTYLWQGPEFSSTQKNLEQATAGDYTLNVADANGCGTSAQVILKSFTSAPLISIDNITLHAAEATSYQWYFNDQLESNGTSKTLVALHSGLYKVMIGNGVCTAKDSIYFQGITWDELNGVLVAPVIEDATYSWYLNNELILNSVGNTTTPIGKGTYKVIVNFDQGNLRSIVPMQAVYEVYFDGSITGVQESDGSFVKIFPNPNNGLFRIDASFELAGKDAVLYSLAGQEMSRQKIGAGSNNSTVNFSEAANGMYYLKVNENKKVIVTKIIIDGSVK